LSFELDQQVAAALAAIAEQSGPLPPPPPVGDIETRRNALNAMLAWANNTAQPLMVSPVRRWSATCSHGIPAIAG
jgi:hypothetical protein